MTFWVFIGIKFRVEVDVSELVLRFDNNSKFAGFCEAVNLERIVKNLCKFMLISLFKIFFSKGWLVELILGTVDFKKVTIAVIKYRWLWVMSKFNMIICQVWFFCLIFWLYFIVMTINLWYFLNQVSFSFVLFKLLFSR